MTTRKIKTAAQIHKTLLHLKEDLYFGFGVPRETTDPLSVPGADTFDPRVKVKYPESLTSRQLAWACDTAETVRHLLFRFSEHDTTRPKQEPSDGPDETQGVKASAARPGSTPGRVKRAAPPR